MNVEIVHQPHAALLFLLAHLTQIPRQKTVARAVGVVRLAVARVVPVFVVGPRAPAGVKIRSGVKVTLPARRSRPAHQRRWVSCFDRFGPADIAIQHFGKSRKLGMDVAMHRVPPGWLVVELPKVDTAFVGGPVARGDRRHPLLRKVGPNLHVDVVGVIDDVRLAVGLDAGAAIGRIDVGLLLRAILTHTEGAIFGLVGVHRPADNWHGGDGLDARLLVARQPLFKAGARGQAQIVGCGWLQLRFRKGLKKPIASAVVGVQLPVVGDGVVAAPAPGGEGHTPQQALIFAAGIGVAHLVEAIDQRADRVAVCACVHADLRRLGQRNSKRDKNEKAHLIVRLSRRPKLHVELP